jgi:hypothetical protein
MHDQVRFYSSVSGLSFWRQPVVDFINIFNCVTYAPTNLICTVVHAPMQRFQNALAYFAVAVSYVLKIFMKSTLVTSTG